MKKSIFVLVILGALLSACGNSESAIATAIAETETARPTETPIPPTATHTPEPTATYTPAPTATPTIDILSEIEYISLIGPLWVEFSSQAIGFQQIFQDMTDDESVLDDVTWKSNALKTAYSLNLAADDLAGIEKVPERFETLQNLFDELSQEVTVFYDDFALFLEDPYAYIEIVTDDIMDMYQTTLEINVVVDNLSSGNSESVIATAIAETAQSTETPIPPTASPTSDYTAELEYFEQISPLWIELKNQVSIVYQEAWVDDLSVLNDPNWKANSLTTVFKMKLAADNLVAVENVPDNHKALQTLFVEHAALITKFYDDYVLFINGDDPATSPYLDILYDDMRALLVKGIEINAYLETISD